MPPTYDDGLVLVAHHIVHDNLAREALITYALQDDTSGTTAPSWANTLQTFFQTDLKSQFDSEVVLTRTTTLRGDGTDVFTTGESTAAGTRGTNAVNTIAANSAVLVKKLTAFGGRGNRGRLYFPWFQIESDVDELGQILAADVTAIQTKITAWLGDVNTAHTDARMVIANREYDRPWDQPGRQLLGVHIGAPVTALKVENYIATQRRRMVRV